ncbi:hypothetical protein D9758_015183 [Tetrapyrgos nigripes]|uniref:Adenylate cyclase n=1 Tax=Tetrapyrgos nigripes TaxID=182062 RepID=A0A8H5C0L8_9AGAR|nr:hypothetical protein D9758_015183 [Tetrapyrgos nigripes]
MKLDTNLDQMDGIVDRNIWTTGANGSISPISGMDSSSHTRSLSNHSNTSYGTLAPILPTDFKDPFTPTTIPPPRSSSLRPNGSTERKISPKTIVPELPHPPISVGLLNDNGKARNSEDAAWAPPESWGVVEGGENHDEATAYSSDDDSGVPPDTPAPVNGKVNGSTNDPVRPVTPPGHREVSVYSKNGVDGMSLLYGSKSTVSVDRMTNASSIGKSSRRRDRSDRDVTSTKGSISSSKLPTSKTYTLRIYRANNTYHVVYCGFQVTVEALMPKLNQKLLANEDNIAHRLYLKENGRERLLGPTERPADIVRRRLEMAGYDLADGMELLGQEGLSFLLKFVYKSQLLGPTEKPLDIDSFEYVNLTGRGLRTIPPVLHQHADQIISLHLSRNPMLDIPLDFIQICSTLSDLVLSHMAMKKVPRSVRACATLNRLDISCNRIADLEEAYLDQISGLKTLLAQNNRMEKLPWYFPRLRSLVSLNISNNKFKEFPTIVCQMENLHDLDISFNMITDLPEEIGQLKNLDLLVMVGNMVSALPDQCSNLVNLRQLDCRRNNILDLSAVTMLPRLEKLSADHNKIHDLPLSLGPNLSSIDASHNELTKVSLVPGPIGQAPYNLQSLDISHARLSTLDDVAIAELSALRTLKLDHNSFKFLPESIGNLSWLELLSCSYNNLETLPPTIGRLQKLEVLDIHNNSLVDLPATLWNCASLMKINATSNLLSSPWEIPEWFHKTSPLPQPIPNGDSSYPYMERKGSATSMLNGTLQQPPLAYSLEKLYLAENQYSDEAVAHFMIFRELRVLNLSFNEITELPSSGNKLTSIPTENLPRLQHLSTLYINGNRLQTLPQELGKVVRLSVLDVGSNSLKYNINNWSYDWNWNFNKNLKYLNLSGNKLLQIKRDPNMAKNPRHGRASTSEDGQTKQDNIELAGFTELPQLRVLGLMDVTILTTGIKAIGIPDEAEDRRVRTSESTVMDMAYGISDTLGKNDYLNMIDLVSEFTDHNSRGRQAVFAMFGRSRFLKAMHPGVSGNRLSKFLHDKYTEVFRNQLESLKPEDGVIGALRRSFLKINQNLHDALFTGRKQSHASGSGIENNEALVARGGASGVVLYFREKTMFVANAGNSLAVISRSGQAHCVSVKHDPYDRVETSRIRAAEGWISPTGLVNDEVDVSRSFGFFHLPYVINARPDVIEWKLTEADEFVIVGNRGLWDFISYQAAVDIARREKADPMIAAQKLRDFALSYGADGTCMIMVISVADLFRTEEMRSQQGSLADTPIFKLPRLQKDDIADRSIRRLREEVPAPVGHLALVFTDIRNSTHLWEVNRGMNTAWRLHNSLLRRLLRFCGGYEVKTEGDAFMCAFPTTLAAVWWCLSVQSDLLNEDWPLEIVECEDGRDIHDGNGTVVARGISVRMGIHCGSPLCERDPVNHRMDYFGPMVNRAARINGSAAGGQIMCSAAVMQEINAKFFDGPQTSYSDFQPQEAIEGIRQIGVSPHPVGELKLKGLEHPEMVTAIYPTQLAARHSMEVHVAKPEDSTVKFSIPQIRELGLVCLRLEALASSRIFLENSERKASIQSANGENIPAEEEAPLYMYGDSNLLLPALNDQSSEKELYLVLDSLSARLDNAVAKLAEMAVRDSFLSALKKQEGLDERTLGTILELLADASKMLKPKDVPKDIPP